jgi:hypothetical protein|tara:strand:+ start:363 stop:713 length:351 start_codon:yes stop_codon:yes gene_type:complete
MRKLFKQFAIFAVVVAVAGVIGSDAFATNYDAGKDMLSDFTGTMKGTMGTTIGLVVSLVGLYMWVWNQVSWGIFVAIAGALLTAFPGIYQSIATGASTSFQSTIGNNTVKEGAVKQ